MAFWRTIVLTVTLTFSAFAGAQDKSVRAMIDEARELEGELQYDLAAERLLEAIADGRATGEELIEANLRAGIINRIIDNDVDARLHFNYVLQRAPETKLPAGLAPKITTFFELIRREILDENARRERDRVRDTTPKGSVGGELPKGPPEGNTALFYTGVGVVGLGAATMAITGPLAILGELTYQDIDAATEDRLAAQQNAPLLWTGVGIGAGITIAGVVLMGLGF